MSAEESIDLHGPCSNELVPEILEQDPEKKADETEDEIFVMEDLGQKNDENRNTDYEVTDANKGGSSDPPVQSFELVESLSVSRCVEVNVVRSEYDGQNSVLLDERQELGLHEINGVKRLRDENVNKESSVRVIYSSLPSHSKRKLEEFLHLWSDWHAKHCASVEDLVDSVESGEETYFPALHVGSDKSSTVSFAMDVHVRKKQRTGSLDNDHSPLYDRGFAFGLSSDNVVSGESVRDVREAPRCFNCNSYNHSLNDCQKPRDNAAVSTARKQFLSKKNQSAGPRVPTRYYQESPGGKFDGLKPGVLSAETRKLLGVGELDPPPWLNRMRELGYPPGYLEKEDPPSGIEIYGVEETQSEALKNETTLDGQKKKLTVDFPGINAPIPENADQGRWALPRVPLTNFCANQSEQRWSNFQNPALNGHQNLVSNGHPNLVSHGHPNSVLNGHQNFVSNGHQNSVLNGHFHGDYRPRNPIEAPLSSFRYGSSPPLHYRHQSYYASEPFSPRGITIPPNPNYDRSLDTVRPPFVHYNYGSF